MTHKETPSTPQPASTTTGSTHAPGSFFARVLRRFGNRATQIYADLSSETDEFFEYHNPMLGVKGYRKSGE